ncbi:hypothetical protein [Seonamhaeicola maritimus]|uniref:hypothetical protein n=1 Tax=Seonamhaeicola maritimus TaxID=2591822 RepID=UPI002494101B|nr:hypothetical protein [Seonamhaeicola maritimus]
MKVIVFTLLICLLASCGKRQSKNSLEGTWKMVYAETLENDSLTIKDLTNVEFVKIRNENHFAFFNQQTDSENAFYGGGGTYTLNGNNYSETLSYISVKNLRGHVFPFQIEFSGDTLIQSGIEKVEKANINRKIIEKYIKIH